MIDTMYRDRSSMLHAYDCRLKLFILPLSVISFFLPLAIPFQLVWTMFFFIICLVFLGIRDFLVPLKMIIPLVILIAILTPLFHREGEVLLSLGSFPFITDQGLDETLRYICRFSGISFLFFIFFRSTPMEDILLGLRWYNLPFTLILIISTALRYIPHLAGLYTQIRAAHSLRVGKGGDGREGKLKALKKIYPMLVSLVIQSIKTIHVLAMALELKGIGRENLRSTFRNLPPMNNKVWQCLSSLLLLVFYLVLLIESL